MCIGFECLFVYYVSLFVRLYVYLFVCLCCDVFNYVVSCL